MTNENEVEETTETNDEELEELEEETEETSDEEELEEESEEDDSEDEDNDSPTLSYYEKLQKELKTLKAQKEHWRKKANLKPGESKDKPKEEIKKTNDNYLTRDEAILLTKGYDEDDIQQLKRIAGDNSLIEASNDPLFKAYKKEKQQKEKASKAQLSSSNRPLGAKKPISEMSDEEHKAYFYKMLKK